MTFGSPSLRCPALALGAALLVSAGLAGCSASDSGSRAETKSTTTTIAGVLTATKVEPDTVPTGATRLNFEVGPLRVGPGQNSIEDRQSTRLNSSH